MLRVLCIGDPHFQDKTRIRHEEMIVKAVELATKLLPDRIVIMGDILDRFKVINQYNLHNAHSFIKQLSEISCVYVLIGNHDRPSNDDFMGPIHPFEGITFGNQDKVKIVYKTTVVYEELVGKDFVYVPYVSNGRFKEALMVGGVDLANTKCIFAHQEFKGSNYRDIISKDGDEWAEDHPFIISGHIHKYQRLGRNIVYVGTPIQFSQDEDVGKTVSLFTFSKDTIYPIEERISLGCKEFKRLYTNVTGFLEWVYSDLYYWKVEITDDESALKLLRKSEKYKLIEQLGITIRLINTSICSLRDRELMLSSQTIDYYESIYTRVHTDELMLRWLNKCNSI